MLNSDQVPSPVEQITDSGVDGDKALSVPHRLELPHPSLGQKIFDISMAEIEAIVEPDSVTNDVREGIGVI